MGLILQVDCTYKISNIPTDSVITIEGDMFDLGDKTFTMQDFQIVYPKVICENDIKVELLKAKGKNNKEIIKKYKKIGLISDLGMNFLFMFIAYHARGMYFKHLCKPHVLKKNILNVETHKSNTEKRENKAKKIGCFGGCLTLICALLIVFVLRLFVIPLIFVASEKPYLVASDYSSITYNDDVYVRIAELPEYAYPTTFLVLRYGRMQE